MRTLTVALSAGLLAGCAAFSGTVDDGGRVYREAQNAPVEADLHRIEPLPATFELFNERISVFDGFGGETDEGERSGCEAERWQQLIGMTEADATAEDLPDAARVVEWGGVVTQDYAPSRMNVHLDQNGRVYRVICG